jgi:heme/copper-type cytochrome/quinol oxidase subunit 2
MELILKIHNFLVHKVYAQSLGGKVSEEIRKLEGNETVGSSENPAEAINSVESLVDTIVNIAVPIAILCLVVLVVYAGYMLISSQGNPDKLKEGREVLTNAIIGFFIVVLSVVILVLLSDTLGLGVYQTQ